MAHAPALLPVLADLIMCDNRFVRSEVRRFFEIWGQAVSEGV